VDAQAKMDKWLADAEKRKYAEATAAALAAVDDTTSTSVDHDNNEDTSREWTHLETLK
jgi:pyridoxine/pyridoxamine 5'-phosphate oxidase